MLLFVMLAASSRATDFGASHSLACSAVAPLATECTTGLHWFSGWKSLKVELPPCIAAAPEGGPCYAGDIRMVLAVGERERVTTCSVLALPQVPPDMVCISRGWVGYASLVEHRCTSYYTTYMEETLPPLPGGIGPWGCRYG